jgi:hypothetical protein
VAQQQVGDGQPAQGQQGDRPDRQPQHRVERDVDGEVLEPHDDQTGEDPGDRRPEDDAAEAADQATELVGAAGHVRRGD